MARWLCRQGPGKVSDARFVAQLRKLRISEKGRWQRRTFRRPFEVEDDLRAGRPVDQLRWLLSKGGFPLRWQDWLEKLPELEKFAMERCFKPQNFGCVVSSQLHKFADVSQECYAPSTRKWTLEGPLWIFDGEIEADAHKVSHYSSSGAFCCRGCY